ncbi:radical SAM/SPASM domain-containing protein [Tissierella sp.]|uniref:radical SAM/SPASM domain-containing protein n=1 Tax=Tissierella sp. TaxID=41274 RepID=UPI002860C965|nr:radical SAM/SPASM domain-containing protein [Tissierella sp.]MDR7857253.1 radical SAM/SPASM domain-containing protein [Tissierella sp.]
MKRFKKVYIEITNVCNLQCEFCPKTARKAKFMTIEEFNYILDQVKEFTDHIYFHVKGEPLVHPRIGEFLDIAHDKELKVNITTNGTLINEVKEKLINKPALRQINISLHSFDGNKGMEDKSGYLDNIFRFIRESRDSKVDKDIELLIIALRLWNLSKDDLINKEPSKNREILNRIEAEFNLEFDIEDKINLERGIRIGEKIYLNHESEFVWPDLNNEIFEDEGFCYGLRDQIGILVDGTVIPCCLDGEGKLDLGNIFETMFSEIIAGKRAKKIYDGFSRRIIVEEMCKRCGFRTKIN